MFRSGDSIRAVAAAYSLSVQHLASVNSNLKDLNKVFVGQKIRILESSVPLSVRGIGLPGMAVESVRMVLSVEKIIMLLIHIPSRTCVPDQYIFGPSVYLEH